MSRIRYDLHTHTTYSDGWAWQEMAATAAETGLDGIGFTDHCPVVADDFGRRERYDFPDTYLERRTEFAEAAAETDLTVLDGAEVNYDPRVEDEIAAFLDEAGFAYTIGSVHGTETAHIPDAEFADADRDDRRAAIDTYVDWQVSLIESELFDVLGHLDLPQRNPAIRDLMTAADHERLADALAASRTVPELNAGRLNRSLGTVHPDPEFLGIYADRDVPFVIGTDSHAPDQLAERIALLADVLPELPVTIRALPPGIRVENE